MHAAAFTAWFRIYSPTFGCRSCVYYVFQTCILLTSNLFIVEELSIISGATTYPSGEVSDSNSSSHQVPNGGSVDDVEPVVYDRSMRSSQSLVFTSGWNILVKEKGPRPRDMVIFSAYECRDGEYQKLCMIDLSYQNGDSVKGDNDDAALQLKIGQPGFDGHQI
ncbi:hypothetical protein Pfo_000672 [Paulownia fortunei]|nr:hypothetical protein Pfo_000672 [Paulownia fortunei]